MFAGFPVSGPVVSADSWAGGREDRWGAPAIRRIIYTLSAEHWLTGCVSPPTVERCSRSGHSRALTPATTAEKDVKACRTQSPTCMEAR